MIPRSVVDQRIRLDNGHDIRTVVAQLACGLDQIILSWGQTERR